MNYYIFVTTDNRLAIKYNSVSKNAKYVEVYRIDAVTIKYDDVEYIKIYCDIGVYNKFISNPFIQKLMQRKQDQPVNIQPDYLKAKYEFFENATKDKIIIIHTNEHLCVYEYYIYYDSSRLDVDLKYDIKQIEGEKNIILYDNNYYLRIQPNYKLCETISRKQHPLMQLEI